MKVNLVIKIEEFGNKPMSKFDNFYSDCVDGSLSSVPWVVSSPGMQMDGVTVP